MTDSKAAPRGLYTGSIGHIAPNGDFTFNVAIRTAVIDSAAMAKSALAAASSPTACRGRIQEALLKMQFFTDPPPDRADRNPALAARQRLLLERRHIDRMAASARYFDLPVEAAASRMLAETAGISPPPPMRVRLLLDEREGPSVTATECRPIRPKFRFLIAPERLDSTSVWLAHKTTNRAFYDQPRQRAHAEPWRRRSCFPQRKQ